jgi:hypothetical protein
MVAWMIIEIRDDPVEANASEGFSGIALRIPDNQAQRLDERVRTANRT